MRSRSQIWKISRRLAALRFAYRPHSTANGVSKTPTSDEKFPHPMGVVEQRSESKAHILFLAGDLVALKRLLRREMNLPVRPQKLQCTSVSIARSRDLRALAVMHALKRSMDAACRPIPQRPSGKFTSDQSLFSTRKH